jgi:hypothetical protein
MMEDAISISANEIAEDGRGEVVLISQIKTPHPACATFSPIGCGEGIFRRKKNWHDRC